MLALLNPKGRTLWRKEKQTLWGLCFPNEYKQPNPLEPQMLFAGQWFDEESGLAYNRFRYYDPESGNYISSDPIGLSGGERPFGYVGNPLDWVDLFGLAGCSKYLDKWGKGKDGFKNFWDNSNYDEFMEAWNNKSFRDNIKTRLRGGGSTTKGGYHEWLPVSQADKFKKMGVSFDDYMRWRTPTSQTSFIDNLGNIGSHTPTTSASSLAHKELIGITDRVNSISEYINYVQKWSQKRLPNGIFDLPF